jgi:hypothetical protein
MADLRAAGSTGHQVSQQRVFTGSAALAPVRAAGAVWAANAVPPGMASNRPAATTAAVMLLRIAGSPFQVLMPAGRAPPARAGRQR